MPATATRYFSEAHRIDQIAPASRNDATANSDWLSMRDYQRLTAVINSGAIAGGGTVNAKLQQAKDTNGAGAKDITGKAITALDDTDDNGVAVIELDASELDIDGRFDCVRLQYTVAGSAAVLGSANIYRWQARFEPVGTTNLQEVIT